MSTDFLLILLKVVKYKYVIKFHLKYYLSVLISPQNSQLLYRYPINMMEYFFHYRVLSEVCSLISTETVFQKKEIQF